MTAENITPTWQVEHDAAAAAAENWRKGGGDSEHDLLGILTQGKGSPAQRSVQHEDIIQPTTADAAKGVSLSCDEQPAGLWRVSHHHTAAADGCSQPAAGN
jgi:hypothetical protein